MKALYGLMAGMGIIGILLYFGVCLGLIGAAIYGLYLAFSASILLGILVLFVQPSPLIIGLVALFFHKNLAQMLIDFLTK